MKPCTSRAIDANRRQPLAAIAEDVDAARTKARAAISTISILEAEQWLNSPFDEDGCSAFSGSLDRAAVTVLNAAMQVEPDPVEAASWYRCTGIAELDGLTAAQLVSLGRADEVIGFLRSVDNGLRE